MSWSSGLWPGAPVDADGFRARAQIGRASRNLGAAADADRITLRAARRNAVRGLPRFSTK
jgi:hypothetical protein